MESKIKNDYIKQQKYKENLRKKESILMALASQAI